MRERTKRQEQKSIDLYQLPDSWEWVTVSDAGAFQKNAIVDGPFGSNLKVSDYIDGGPVPVLTTKNLEGNYEDVRYISQEKFEALKRSAVCPGDILMAKIGSCGATGIYPANMPPAMIPANLLKVTVNEYFDLKYVYHYFNSSFFQDVLKTIIKATAQPAFGVTNFRRLPLPFPPKNEQKRIVGEIEKQFSRLDEAVDNLNRVKANLKRYKASVLKAAVEGELTEEWRKQHPDVESADKLLERILAERRKKWEEAELARMKARGKLPKTDKWKKRYKEPFSADISGFPSLPIGWCWAAVEQLASHEERSIQSGPFGSNLLHSEFQEIGKLAIGIDNVKDGHFSMGSENRISNKKFEDLAKYSARPEDVLITVMSSIGRTCVVPKDIELAIITKHVYRITVNKEFVSPHFLNLALWGGPIVLKQIRSQVRGQTRPGLNGTIIRQLIIPVPPLAEQQEILSITNQQLSNLDVILPTVKKAELRGKNLRSSILKKAFSGKLVKQDPLDEPASVLLDSIKRDTAYEPLVSKEKRKRREDMRGGKMKTDKIKRPLKDVLSAHPDGITPEALLTGANYSIEEIDAFYAHLANIADQIEQDKPVGSKALRWPYEAQVILRLRKQ